MTPEPKLRRYKVKASGETGSAVSEHGLGHVVIRSVTIGTRKNVDVIDLCDDETGQIRTFLKDALEEI